MGFAAQWAAVMEEAQGFSDEKPIRNIRTIRTIPSQAYSANTANHANRGSALNNPQHYDHSANTANIAKRYYPLKDRLSLPRLNTMETGLEWIVWPADDTVPDFVARWAAYDLADLCKLYAVRIVAAGKRILAIFPPSLEPELVAYAGSLLAEAQDYLSTNVDRLPILSPAQAVKIILDIMRAHKGLRFCRGDGGSRWPLYPKDWTAGQKATVQSLWQAAGDALDSDLFMEVDQ